MTNRIRWIIAGFWLAGLGFLLETRLWWPGILYLSGLGLLLWSYALGWERGLAQAGLVTLLVSVWLTLRVGGAVLFVMLGLGLIVTAVLQTRLPSKPFVDNSLE